MSFHNMSMKVAGCLVLLSLPLIGAIEDARVRAILTARQHKFPATVVGFIDERGPRWVAQGTLSSNGDSVFEIGSITKVFTGILLAEMVERGEVSLDDPVQKYLPEDAVKVPMRGDKPITLLSLATQSSGLLRLPFNLAPKDGANPYADYTVAQLYEAVTKAKLTHDPLQHYEYSNFGMGLLGHALARRAGKSYYELLRERVLAPLEMNDTGIELTASQRERLLPGHTPFGQPAKNWDIPTLAGAGALRSTAKDMLKLLEALLGLRRPPPTLQRALARSVESLLPAGDGLEIGLAWHILKRRGPPIVWHNGGTGGYRSWIGFSPETKTAVVVLTNVALSVDDIGLHLMHGEYRLTDHRPNKNRRELLQEESVLARHVGRYQVPGGPVLTVLLAEGRLHLQLGQQKVRLFAEAPSRYFARDDEIQVEFGGDALLLRTAMGVTVGQRIP